MNRILIFSTLLLLTGNVFATDNVVNTETQNTMTHNTISQNTESNTAAVGSAKDWNLTDAEWSKYQMLMQGASGYYFSHYTPPEVLGLNSENETDLKHFAEIDVRLEHDKNEKELRLNKAFNDAANRIYANEPIIKSFDMTPYTPIPKDYMSNTKSLQSGDHLVLFVDVKESTSSNKLAELISQVQSNKGTVLDIYCVNAANEEAIQGWAKTNSLPVVLVSTNRITLNNDRGKFKKVSNTSGLPYAMLVRDGKSQSVDGIF
jgi:integrating conjugative element protein (TIGR03759 family)